MSKTSLSRRSIKPAIIGIESGTLKAMRIFLPWFSATAGAAYAPIYRGR